jgi:hypothetical protein
MPAAAQIKEGKVFGVREVLPGLLLGISASDQGTAQVEKGQECVPSTCRSSGDFMRFPFGCVIDRRT